MKALRRYQEWLMEKGVPGTEIIVCREHQPIYHECMGIAKPEDRYFLYSCTKPVTAVAAMLCLEKGLFQLDDPVAKYLPAYEHVRVLEDGQLVAPRTVMTVRHLFTMSAGFDYGISHEALRDLPRDATTRQFADAMANKPLLFHPGERYMYGLNLDVLGAVMEVATGMTLDRWYKEQIFAPLGMNDTYFGVLDQQDDRLAQQFNYLNGTVVPVAPRNSLTPYTRFLSGGAGLISTASDYARFADGMACGAILKPETQRWMTTSQLSMDGLKSTFTCTCGEEYAYGLGVRTRISTLSGRPGSLGEWGWDGAAAADLLVDPERKISAVLLQHLLGWPNLLPSFHLDLRDSIYQSIDG